MILRLLSPLRLCVDITRMVERRRVVAILRAEAALCRKDGANTAAEAIGRCVDRICSTSISKD